MGYFAFRFLYLFCIPTLFLASSLWADVPSEWRFSPKLTPREQQKFAELLIQRSEMIKDCTGCETWVVKFQQELIELAQQEAFPVIQQKAVLTLKNLPPLKIELWEILFNALLTLKTPEDTWIQNAAQVLDKKELNSEQVKSIQAALSSHSPRRMLWALRYFQDTAAFTDKLISASSNSAYGYEAQHALALSTSDSARKFFLSQLQSPVVDVETLKAFSRRKMLKETEVSILVSLLKNRNQTVQVLALERLLQTPFNSSIENALLNYMEELFLLEDEPLSLIQDRVLPKTTAFLHSDRFLEFWIRKIKSPRELVRKIGFHYLSSVIQHNKPLGKKSQEELKVFLKTTITQSSIAKEKFASAVGLLRFETPPPRTRISYYRVFKIRKKIRLGPQSIRRIGSLAFVQNKRMA